MERDILGTRKKKPVLWSDKTDPENCCVYAILQYTKSVPGDVNPFA